ncbi:MAG: DUF1064 domain-containing protein [Syntrophales bacterium]
MNWTDEQWEEYRRNNPDLEFTDNKTGVSIVPGETSVNMTLKQVSTPTMVPANKYHVSAKEDRTYNGITYDSKKEMQKAQELDLLVKAGEIDFWLRQVVFPLPGGITYRADFVTFVSVFYDEAESPHWNIEVIEVKGMWTDTAKLKMKLFKVTYPNLTLEVV